MSQILKVQIPGFKGGIANDEYADLRTQQFVTAKDLEVFTNERKLGPHLNMINDSTSQTLNTIQPFYHYKASDANHYLLGLGSAGDGHQAIFKDSSSLGTTTTFTEKYHAGGTGVAQHNLTEFLDKLWFWDTSTQVAQYDISGETVAGAVSSLVDQAPLFVHEGIKKIYYTVARNSIGGSADITPTNDVLIAFDTNQYVKNMCPFGQFVAVGLETKNNSKTSKIAIWDGSATTVDDIIDIGDSGLQAIANVNNSIYAITTSNPAGFGTFNVIRIYKWSGQGPVELVWELDLKATAAAAVTVNTGAVAVHKGTLFFGMDADTANSMTIDNGIYAYNEKTKLLTLDRILSDTSNIDIRSVTIAEGEPVVTWYDGSDYKFSHPAGDTKSARGTYESPIFRLDTTGQGRRGRIKTIKVIHDTLPSSCGYKVKVRQFGTTGLGVTPAAEESFVQVANVTTANSTYSYIQVPDTFAWADSAQIQILFDDINGANAASIIFPITMEVEVADRMI